MLNILLIHYCTVGDGLRFVEKGSINHIWMCILGSISSCSVNVFVVISGYYLCKRSTRSLNKAIFLLTQTICYSIIDYFIYVIAGNGFSLKSFIGCFIPDNYYVILYIALFLVSPYINIVIDALSERAFRNMLILFVAIFSIWNTLGDLLAGIMGHEWIGLSTIGAWGTQKGYTIVNFVLCYIVGGYIAKYEDSLLKHIKKIRWGIILCILVLTAWGYCDYLIGGTTGQTAWVYSNPLVITEAALLLLLFRNKNMGIIKAVNVIAAQVFSVFLSQAWFWTYINVETYVNGNIVILILHMLFSAFSLFAVGVIVGIIYNHVIPPILNIALKYTKRYSVNPEIKK